ncbi:uncharacterized protein LOC107867798 [Capsicum annuum]|uniref:uncharacterized protein LOC107867798 n=1 Tax=Capsicum annuum TaxID=4072 RepID=UPI001FB105F9|nr:uncharacterized protein LOC107867798 [Capsicum annuum]XP_047267860.1 uncharacterized protein LOC107867798 [Capsicum annuum]
MAFLHELIASDDSKEGIFLSNPSIVLDLSNRLLPSTNDQDVIIEREIIIQYVMGNIVVNLGEMIIEMIKLISKKLETLFLFLTLTSMICFADNVPIFSKIYQRIKCNRLIDITHSQDYDNPTGIKRKSTELVDSSLGELPSFEGIDTPLVPSLISDTPQVSSDTTPVVDPPHAPPSSSTAPTTQDRCFHLLPCSGIHYRK